MQKIIDQLSNPDPIVRNGLIAVHISQKNIAQNANCSIITVKRAIKHAHKCGILLTSQWRPKDKGNEYVYICPLILYETKRNVESDTFYPRVLYDFVSKIINKGSPAEPLPPPLEISSNDSIGDSLADSVGSAVPPPLHPWTALESREIRTLSRRYSQEIALKEKKRVKAYGRALEAARMVSATLREQMCGRSYLCSAGQRWMVYCDQLKLVLVDGNFKFAQNSPFYEGYKSRRREILIKCLEGGLKGYCEANFDNPEDAVQSFLSDYLSEFDRMGYLSKSKIIALDDICDLSEFLNFNVFAFFGWIPDLKFIKKRQIGEWTASKCLAARHEYKRHKELEKGNYKAKLWDSAADFCTQKAIKSAKYGRKPKQNFWAAVPECDLRTAAMYERIARDAEAEEEERRRPAWESFMAMMKGFVSWICEESLDFFSPKSLTFESIYCSDSS